MAVYTRVFTTIFGAQVEYEDRFAADFQNTIVRRFSRDPAQLRFFTQQLTDTLLPTYTHAPVVDKGGLWPQKGFPSPPRILRPHQRTF